MQVIFCMRLSANMCMFYAAQDIKNQIYGEFDSHCGISWMQDVYVETNCLSVNFAYTICIACMMQMVSSSLVDWGHSYVTQMVLDTNNK